jgi:NTE family protein
MGKLFGRKQYGLVFGGGGVRGGAHAGAWRVLHDAGYQPDVVVGASVGALVAGMVGMGKLPNEMEQIFRVGSPALLDTACNDGRGKTRTERLACLLREIFGEADLRDLSPMVAVTATDLIGQQRVLITQGLAWKAVQASMSIPGVFDPVEWGDYRLVDGGVLDNVPTQAAYQLGADALVAVDIGDDAWNVDTALSTVACVNRQLHRMLNWAVRFTNREVMVDTWIRSAMLPASKLSQFLLAACPPDVMIKPEMGGISLLSMNRVAETFKVGENAANEKLSEIRNLLRTRRTPRKEVPKYLPAMLTL